MSNKQDINKKQFYSKLKTTKKINSRPINREELEDSYRSLRRRAAKFQKDIIEEIILKLLTWEQIAMLCVHSWQNLQSLARKIQVGRSVFHSTNFLS